jgi:membrane protein DedA with SNARE-associated domain
LRIAVPIAIGMSGVRWRRFLVLNVIGAAIWVPLVTGAGYLLGHTLEILLEDIHRYEETVFIGVLAGAGLWWVIRKLRQRAG